MARSGRVLIDGSEGEGDTGEPGQLGAVEVNPSA
jgi:hypothetical protein